MTLLRNRSNQSLKVLRVICVGKEINYCFKMLLGFVLFPALELGERKILKAFITNVFV